jgi:hypothetical protein
MLNETNFTVLAFSKTGTAYSPGALVVSGFGFPPGVSLTGLSAMLSLLTLVLASFLFTHSALALASFPIDCTIDSAWINCPQAFCLRGI